MNTLNNYLSQLRPVNTLPILLIGWPGELKYGLFFLTWVTCQGSVSPDNMILSLNLEDALARCAVKAKKEKELKNHGYEPYLGRLYRMMVMMNNNNSADDDEQ